jgi:hypothetical protein
MSKLLNVFSWAGIVLLGLINGVLEDILFVRVVVEYMPPSWDLTGDLFFTFTVPLCQLLALAITGTLAWFFLGLWKTPRLITFWVCWSASRATFLTQINNPVEDVLIYLAWIAFWCALIGVIAYLKGKGQPETAGEAA